MKFRLTLILILLVLLIPVPARADGIVVPEPPICDPRPCPPPCPGPFPCPIPSPMTQLAIRYHHVEVTIEDQIATTRVDQVFFNPNDWAVEGTYIFPLPQGAAATDFTLWVDGEPVKGEILEAEQARQTYQEIVSSLRDPALLEYFGQGAVRAHVFPIPPQGERRIELEYSQALQAEEGLVRYVYPLSTEKFSLWPLENVTVNVEIRSEAPIRAVYSPSHPVAVSREDDHHVRAGYEAQDVLPDSDFALYYSTGETPALHLLSYRDPAESEADGFFLLMLAPGIDAGQEPLPKDLLLVLDRSGSMEGEKFAQAQEALRYILSHLNPGDRFNLIAFSTGLETYAGGMRPAEEAEQATGWVDRLDASGATDINRALLEAAAMTDRERPAYLIFLTDGLPTEGVVENAEILRNFEAAAPQNLRLFAFGVGYDVDTYLLDSLAQAQHGTSTYVMPGERLDETLSGFYARISAPVLTDLELDFGDLAVYDLYPSPLPDLFRGSQIILAGRYRQGGATTIRLSGEVNGERQAYTFEPAQRFATEPGGGGPQAMIPRLWATRKIGHLLNQIRLDGPNQELIDQVVRLSIRYGIVTPYTSYLVTEPLPLGAQEQERIANEQYDQMLAAPQAEVSGQAAVERAAGEGALSAAGAPAALDAGEQGAAAGKVRVVGSQAFVLSEGAWIDTAYDPDQMETVKVPFLSDDYFALAAARPELGAAFALGERVIALSGGVAYEVIPAGEPGDPVQIPASATPGSATPEPGVLTPEPGATPEPPSAPSGVLDCLGVAAVVVGLPLLVVWRKRGR